MDAGKQTTAEIRARNERRQEARLLLERRRQIIADAPIHVGDRVTRRKPDRKHAGQVGTVERVSCWPDDVLMARVRWHNAVHMLSGTTDWHSELRLTSLVLVEGGRS